VTAVPDTSWAPPDWRDLLSELNGRAPDGTPGVRDVDAPCDVYQPVDLPMDADASGDCETDGHYLCADGRSVCRHISERALRRRRDRCEQCGTKLVVTGTHLDRCPSCEPTFDAVGAILSYVRARGSAPEEDVLRALAASEQDHHERHQLGHPGDKPLAALELLGALVKDGRLARIEGEAIAYATAEGRPAQDG
jgi:hypothetical protein